MRAHPRLTVRLSSQDIRLAQAEGIKRSHNCRKNGVTDLLVDRAKEYEMDRIGAEAELAFAKITGLPWNHSMFSREQYAGSAARGNDVGPFEVRATTWAQGKLLVYDYNDAAAPYVLVVVDRPLYAVVGGLYGGSAQRPEFWNEEMRIPCFAVPQFALRPPKEFVGEVLEKNGIIWHRLKEVTAKLAANQ